MAATEPTTKKSHDNPQGYSCGGETIHIQIGENGEINAWGLDQNSEEIILERTGNYELAKQQQNMSYTLCG
ncbi:MAG: hypothetical protein KAW01_00275 [Deltaproteobacteria bacterium]|jgi:hypothetical protein|nr:hypothetical protein [Deltaproteobacteria bacterium]